MFPEGIAFKIELEFYEAEKAHYAIVIADARERRFSLNPAGHVLFVGIAQYVDGFPLSWEAHDALELKRYPHRLRVCKEMLHNAIAIWMPREFLKRGIRANQFTPIFPDYVGPHSHWFRKMLADSV